MTAARSGFASVKVALLFVHLALVGIGASQRDWLSRLGGFGAVLEHYSSLSGANSGYGFFAPGVGSQLRARFEVTTGKNVRTETLERGFSREADLRIGNILGWFWSGMADQKVKRSLAASWAGKMYGRYPQADKVVVRLDTYDLPTMSEYRAGKRPRWNSYYLATFVRKSPLTR